jgi:predicted RNase H-like HicB family nuclease
MVTVTVYKVTAAREGDKWTADVPSVPGAHTWARSIDGLDANVREVIALVLDLPEGAEDTLDLQWDYHTGQAAWDETTAALRAARREVEKKAAELTDLTSKAAAELVPAFSVRDMAALLGLSYQRISQLLSKTPAPPAPVKRAAPQPVKKAQPAKKAAKKTVAVKAARKAPARMSGRH